MNCTCKVEETTGWTTVKCCNVCGLPIPEEIWEADSERAVGLKNIVMQENLRALEKLTAKQALEINDLQESLQDKKQKIKRVLSKITCIGAPLNDNLHQYNKKQLEIFFEIEQILSA